MNASLVISLLIVFSLILIIRSKLDKGYKAIFLFLITVESFTLIFFFDYFNNTTSFILLICCLYLFSRIGLYPIFEILDFTKISLKTSKEYHVVFGVILAILVLFYEYYFSDFKFGTKTQLILFYASFLILYGSFLEVGNPLYLFTFLFLSLVLVFYALIPFVIEINIFNIDLTFIIYFQDNFTNIFLARPLAKLLTLTGYNSWHYGSQIFFEDLEAGRISSVYIAASCTGVHSLSIFLFAVTSFLVISRNLFSRTQLVTIYALVIISSYFSNLIRMYIVILSGHYYGIDSLLWMHKYVGSFIFAVLLGVFWSLILRTSNIDTSVFHRQ